MPCSNVNFHGSAILRGCLLKGYLESCSLPGCLIGDREALQSLLMAVESIRLWDGLVLIEKDGMRWFLIVVDGVNCLMFECLFCLNLFNLIIHFISLSQLL